MESFTKNSKWRKDYQVVSTNYYIFFYWYLIVTYISRKSWLPFLVAAPLTSLSISPIPLHILFLMMFHKLPYCLLPYTISPQPRATRVKLSHLRMILCVQRRSRNGWRYTSTTPQFSFHVFQAVEDKNQRVQDSGNIFHPMLVSKETANCSYQGWGPSYPMGHRSKIPWGYPRQETHIRRWHGQVYTVKTGVSFWHLLRHRNSVSVSIVSTLKSVCEVWKPHSVYLTEYWKWHLEWLFDTFECGFNLKVSFTTLEKINEVSFSHLKVSFSTLNRHF
jgi:hypothetical protein